MKLPNLPPPVSSSSDSGFTILESLIAIVVVAILLASISPIIIFSVATRVQSRRVELATQAARTYIDGVRSDTVAAPPRGTGTASTQPAPTSTGTLSCAADGAYCGTTAPTNSLFCVNRDATAGCAHTSNTDLVIHAFRLNSASTEATRGYLLGVRVYRADAFRDTTALQLQPDQKAFTSGLGLRKYPLVQMTTEVLPRTGTYQDLRDRLTPPTTP